MKAKRDLPPVFTQEEMKARGLAQLDFVFISGDAYIDHPSFGTAIIARILIHNGYTVGIIPQPDWHGPEAFRALGRPRLGFLASAGNLDSMVNHYTAAKRRRSEDAYTPGGEAGKRPDRACVVYGNRCREAYPGVPVILGGIEASLRRFAHYDYWDDRVRHSILYDTTADVLVYGMGERAILAIAAALRDGASIHELTDVPGTCVRVGDPSACPEAILLPSFTEVSADKRAYAAAFLAQMREQDAVRGKRLIQPHEKGCLLCNPPAAPLTQEELDQVYALPYTRAPMPAGQKHIPALDEVSFSITSARGCFGNCSFCALTFHQGRVLQARSRGSVVQEAEQLTKTPGFAGYIHDVGGPTANFRIPACEQQRKNGVCPDRQCLGFAPCKNLRVSETDYADLLKELRELPGVKKVFVRSGVRYDYLLLDRSNAFLDELIAHHVSGQLKVAPEHVSDRVLQYMNKPPHAVFERFVQKYEAANRRLGMKQYLVPYLMSSHPGCTLADAVELALYIKRSGHRPEQVQDFYPTPGTLSTCMFYTGLDPRTMEPVYVPRDPAEKAMQRALMQYYLPGNRALAAKALRLAGREDLIGTDRDCLVPPPREREREKKREPGPEKRRKPKNTVDKRHRSS